MNVIGFDDGPFARDYRGIDDLFGNFTGGAYVLRDKFIRDNPNTSHKLVEGISRAIAWAQTTPPEDVRVRFERIIADRKRNEDAIIIPFA